MKAAIIDLEKIQERIKALEPIVEANDGEVHSTRELGEMSGELNTLKRITYLVRHIPSVEHPEYMKILTATGLNTMPDMNNGILFLPKK